MCGEVYAGTRRPFVELTLKSRFRVLTRAGDDLLPRVRHLDRLIPFSYRFLASSLRPEPIGSTRKAHAPRLINGNHPPTSTPRQRPGRTRRSPARRFAREDSCGDSGRRSRLPPRRRHRRRRPSRRRRQLPRGRARPGGGRGAHGAHPRSGRRRADQPRGLHRLPLGRFRIGRGRGRRRRPLAQPRSRCHARDGLRQRDHRRRRHAHREVPHSHRAPGREDLALEARHAPHPSPRAGRRRQLRWTRRTTASRASSSTPSRSSTAPARRSRPRASAGSSRRRRRAGG